MTLWTAGDLLSFEEDFLGLPVCVLKGDPPYHYPPETPAPAGMDETDPWFILGNYGLTLFTHASGSYQLLHTESGFARLNHDGSDRVTGRDCHAIVRVGDREYDLLQSTHEERLFGCGYASWSYRLEPDLHVTRRLEVLPSNQSADHNPAFRVTVHIENLASEKQRVEYHEGLGARYHAANWKNPPTNRQAAEYPVSGWTEGSRVTARFQPRELLPLAFDNPGWWALADSEPLALHMEALHEADRAIYEPGDSELNGRLGIEATEELEPGETAEIRLLIGWSGLDSPWEETRERWLELDNEPGELWAERLPQFPGATAAERGELLWHAHTLHAMATWDARYLCTFIPQGTLYEYGLGVAAVTRDHAMHALPACYYDPDLARSVLRYLCRHTDHTGRIQHTDEGAGMVPLGCDQKSDNQLFALLLAVEYLEQTGDTASLADEDPFFPLGCETMGSTLDRIARWVRYLRDVVHVGQNGLVRILFSDLSDTLHSAFDNLSYPQVFNGESYVNTTMALNVLRRLAEWLEQHQRQIAPDLRNLAEELRRACQEFEARLREALFKDLEDRPWAPRGRVGEFVLGEEDAFAAPQSFLLSNPDLPEERRRQIWQNIKPRLWDGEHFGVRLREGQGKHRCGMVWYAWSGMFIWNLAKIDPQAAREGFERLSLRRRAQIEPRQWVGLWSHSDVTWGYHGAPDQIPGTTRIGYVKPFPIPCAHVHAWPLMLWFAGLDKLPGNDPAATTS